MDVQQFFAALTDAPWLLTTLDLIGIFFFATSGALLASRKQFDLVGSLALSLLAGLGGLLAAFAAAFVACLTVRGWLLRPPTPRDGPSTGS